MDEADRLSQYDSDEPQPAHALDGRHWFTYAIGAVVMSGSRMDVAVGTLYAALLDSDLARVVAYGQSFDVTRQACLAAMNAFEANPVFDHARKTLQRAKELYEDRNQVAHGLWTGESGAVNNPRSTVRYKRHGKVDDEDWTQRGLTLLAASMVDMSVELTKIAEVVRTLRAYPDFTVAGEDS